MRYQFMVKLKDSLLFNFLLLLFLVLTLKWSPVPNGSEFVYLLGLVKQWEPSYLSNDWMFGGGSRALHLVFNDIFGILTLVVSMETVGWIGRFVCWCLILAALFRLGSHFEIPPWMISLSIALWLLQDQSLIAGEFILGGFEAKSVAYALLLFSLDGFVRGRDLSPAILLGLSFSLHPAIGLWGGLAIGISLVVLKVPIYRLVKIAGWTLLCALPGLIPFLPTVFGDTGSSLETWKFIALVRMPNHLDPLSWPKRDIASCYLMLLFNWLHFRKYRDDMSLRFLIWFQLSLSLFFLIGVGWRITEHFELLKFMPFRLFPVFVLLFFFFTLSHLVHTHRNDSSNMVKPVTAALGFVILMSLNNPLGALVDQVSRNYSQWAAESDDIQRAMKWLATNTPTESVAILPPWRIDSWYLSERAQIANWRFVSFDRVNEWRQRIEAMVGNNWANNSPKEAWSQEMERYYNSLTEAHIESIVKSYGGDYLVSRNLYSFPVVFDSGTYKVYALKTIVHRGLERTERAHGTYLITSSPE